MNTEINKDGCVCKDCENHCTCEIHKEYEATQCNEGEHPINGCTFKPE